MEDFDEITKLKWYKIVFQLKNNFQKTRYEWCAIFDWNKRIRTKQGVYKRRENGFVSHSNM